MAFNLTEIELTLRAKAALAEYLALPDRGEITSRMQLVNSANDAVRQIQDASMEAWRIRRTLADSWCRDMQQRVGRLLDAQFGDLSLDEKKIHPVFGPVLAALYPKGITQYAFDQARLVWENLDREEKAERRKKSRALQREAAKNTTRHREHKVMAHCVQEFCRWAEKTGEMRSLEAVSRFPKIEGIVLKRSHELLRTLISAQNQPSVWSSLLETLQEQSFPNASQQAVDDCMAILGKQFHPKIVLARTPPDEFGLRA